MKKLFFPFLAIFILITSCNDAVVKKPENLIAEDKMVDIIYDLSLLDAIKAQGTTTQKSYPTASEFLKKKYNVDSITFANNSKYYASDIKNYKKMYDRVKDRLNEENAKLNGVKPAQQTEEQGVVK